MLKRGSRRQPCSLLQFLHQLPSVKRIQKINISRLPIQNTNRQFTPILHINPGRLLIRITSIFQFHFIHISYPFPAPLSTAAILFFPYSRFPSLSAIPLLLINNSYSQSLSHTPLSQYQYTLQTAKPYSPHSGFPTPFWQIHQFPHQFPPA